MLNLVGHVYRFLYGNFLLIIQVMEVRRLSETTLRHHSRRPSVDNSKYAHYAPHTVGCKRRRTGGSDGGTRGGNHTHYVRFFSPCYYHSY